MDNKKFAQDAFAQAQRATLDAEAEEFDKYIQSNGMMDMLKAVVIAGADEMSKIIETVQRMGLEDVMHMYEKAIICNAFHAGCQAGQMMKSTK
jgi:hypothetical protein